MRSGARVEIDASRDPRGTVGRQHRDATTPAPRTASRSTAAIRRIRRACQRTGRTHHAIANRIRSHRIRSRGGRARRARVACRRRTRLERGLRRSSGEGAQAARPARRSQDERARRVTGAASKLRRAGAIGADVAPDDAPAEAAMRAAKSSTPVVAGTVVADGTGVTGVTPRRGAERAALLRRLALCARRLGGAGGATATLRLPRAVGTGWVVVVAESGEQRIEAA